MATNDIQERMQALWQDAESAYLTDVWYAITAAEASSAARERQQKREASSRVPVGV